MQPSLSPARDTAERDSYLFDQDKWLLLLWIANAIVSIALRESSTLATIHAALVILFALYLTIFGKRSEYVAYACAFICGSEVLWRMSRAGMFYEVAKYAIALCSLITIARLKRKYLPAAAVTYFLLLIPGLLIPLITMHSSGRLQKQISFNFSGPIALAAAMCFFANLALDRKQVWRMILFLVTPIIGIAAVTLFFTHTARSEDLVFDTESNTITSAGFGPNQVSSTLGLGAVLLLLYLAQEDMGRRRKLMVSAALVLCAMQSALTFSRSGLYGAFGAFAVAVVFLLGNARVRARIAGILIAGVALAVFVVIPYLVAFTGGAITKRFSDTKMSGREAVMETDYELWKRNPIYGVGVGVSTFYHPRGLVAHNELSRMMAEHGLFGIAALVAILLYTVHRLMLARGAVERAFVAAMFTWSILFMMVNGFRVAAPAFILGLTCLNTRFDVDPVLNVAKRPGPVSRRTRMEQAV